MKGSIIDSLHEASLGKSARSSSDVSIFAIIDPDAKGDWGHFLAYDKRVAEGCRDQGVAFALICRKELDPKYYPDKAEMVLPVFSVHSWTVGNKWPSTNNTHLTRFCLELSEAFSRLEERYPEGRICIFMYVGSVEVAEAIEQLLMTRPRFRAVINLFWSYNFEQNDPAYKARWYPVVKRLAKSGQVFITHSTQQIADEFTRDWSVNLPVLPHPSTTFDDNVVVELTNLPEAQPGKPLRVIFPGGARKEKGFLLATSACELLADSPDLRLGLRARIDNVSGKELEDSLQHLVALAGDKVEILDNDLSDDEFVDMIRDADIVVIPYLSEAFRRRTSGILVDAFLLGKPVVVLNNTWLSDIVGVGNIGVCADPNPVSLANAIREVSQRYSDFLPGLSKVRCDYLRMHSWNALVKKVIEWSDYPLSMPKEEIDQADQRMTIASLWLQLWRALRRK